MTTYLYGYSDDLIELDGDLYEEVPWLIGEWTDVVFSNGVHAQIILGDIWTIRVLETGDAVVKHYMNDDERAKSFGNYTEVLAVEGAEWAIVGKKVLKDESRV